MLCNVNGKDLRESIRGGARRPESENKSEQKKRKEYSRERLDEDINICLTCTKERCTGYCKRIQESRRAISNERKRERHLSSE